VFLLFLGQQVVGAEAETGHARAGQQANARENLATRGHLRLLGYGSDTPDDVTARSVHR
jgi:hypothetical protein